MQGECLVTLVIPASVGAGEIVARCSPHPYTMSNTATLATVTPSAASDTDLFGMPLATRDTRGTTTPIVSKKGTVTGRRLTFDSFTLAEFKDKLTGSGLTAAQKKLKRQEFLNADAIKRRQLMGEMALRQAYEPDEFAPMGRVPDVMDLRKGGTIRLVSVQQFHGKGPGKDGVDPALAAALAKVKELEARLAGINATTAGASIEVVEPEAETPAAE